MRLATPLYFFGQRSSKFLERRLRSKQKACLPVRSAVNENIVDGYGPFQQAAQNAIARLPLKSSGVIGVLGLANPADHHDRVAAVSSFINTPGNVHLVRFELRSGFLAELIATSTPPFPRRIVARA